MWEDVSFGRLKKSLFLVGKVYLFLGKEGSLHFGSVECRAQEVMYCPGSLLGRRRHWSLSLEMEYFVRG